MPAKLSPNATIRIPRILIIIADFSRRIFPIAAPVAPKRVNIVEKPATKKIVFITTMPGLSSISSRLEAVINEKYAGIIGNIHGLKKLKIPNRNVSM